MKHSMEQLGLMIAATQRQRAAKMSNFATATRAAFGADRREFLSFLKQLNDLSQPQP